MGGPIGLNLSLPVLTNPVSFAHAAVFGAGGVSGKVWQEVALQEAGLKRLARLLEVVREGRVRDMARAQRIIEHLAARDWGRIKEALAFAQWQDSRLRRQDRFGEFDSEALEAILLPPVAEQRVSATADGRASHGPRRKSAQLASTPTPTTAVVTPHPYTIALLRGFSSALVAAQLAEVEGGARFQTIAMDHYFPADITLLLDRIFRVLDKIAFNRVGRPETGQELERVLVDAGITVLQWTHTEKAGSFATLHRTPKVPGASKEGVLTLAVLLEGHRAPTHIHRSGSTKLPGEITLGIYGTLKYRDYSNPDGPDAAIQEAPAGQVRISPAGSKDVYSKQTDLWLGVYWQPEPARMVPEAKSMEVLLAKVKEQLASMADEIRILASQSSPDLRVIIERREQEYEGKESSELFGIVDNAFTFITNARRTLDQWTSPQLKEKALGEIVAHLIILVAVQNVLTRRGVL